MSTREIMLRRRELVVASGAAAVAALLTGDGRIAAQHPAGLNFLA